jgi:pilus assembly protein TadC
MSATLRASSEKSSFSARHIASMRDSGMSPLASMRLTLDSAMPSARARSA